MQEIMEDIVMSEEIYVCPHCEEVLSSWSPSPYHGWANDLYYCHNDECSYFIEGRQKICVEFEKNFAYRYCFNPENGKHFPLIAWCGGDLSLLKGRCGELPGT